MARRKPQAPDSHREADHREELEARIAELIERAQRHQRLADEHLQEARRLKATGMPKPPKRKRR
jgi:hypothetical protein